MQSNGRETLFNGSGWQHHAPSTDPLMYCLIWISKYHQRSFSPSAILAGLPLNKGFLTPESCVRAAERIGFHSQVLTQSLVDIVTSDLPAILLTKDHQAIILEKRYNETYSLINLQGQPVQKNLHELSEEYSGQMIVLRPDYQFRNDHLVEDEKAKQSWFWGTIKRMWSVYSEAIVASLLINLFVLASPLFIMNVYDRVVPNNATDTLWVLTSGVVLVFAFDFILRLLRSYFIDQASKYVDSHLSANIFAQILSLKMSVRPQSMGVLAHLVHSFEAFREFITSTTITAVVDLPFTVLFLIVIFLLGGWLVVIPLTVIPFVILVGFLIQRPLNRLIKQSFKLGAEKQATLFESLNNIETIKMRIKSLIYLLTKKMQQQCDQKHAPLSLGMI